MGWLWFLIIPGYIAVWLLTSRIFYGSMRAKDIDNKASKSYYTLQEAIDAFDEPMAIASSMFISAFWPAVLPFYGLGKLVQASPRLSNAEKAAQVKELEITIQKLEQENRRLGGY